MTTQEESSSIQTNPDPINPSHLPRIKRRKLNSESTSQSHHDHEHDHDLTRWRTEAEKQTYSSKLVDALRRLRRPDSAAATGRAVRDAADRVLAASAKGKTRWSRAIMTRRMSLRLAQINKRHKKAAKPEARFGKPASGRKNLKPKPPVLQRKVRVLSRLVPGCRKVSLPSLLEETTDYIAALEMQVKAMTFLTALLSGAVPLSGLDQLTRSSS